MRPSFSHSERSFILTFLCCLIPSFCTIFLFHSSSLNIVSFFSSSIFFFCTPNIFVLLSSFVSFLHYLFIYSFNAYIYNSVNLILLFLSSLYYYSILLLPFLSLAHCLSSAYSSLIHWISSSSLSAPLFKGCPHDLLC